MLASCLTKSLLIVASIFTGHVTVSAASPDDQLKAILSVSKEGGGNIEAIAAVKALSQSGSETLIPLLKSFERANPLAINWLRGVVDTIAEREVQKAGKLPASDLEQFIKNKSNNAEARRLAYEWLVKVDATAADRLIPGMLLDSNAEFRRDAVERILKVAIVAQEQGKKAAAVSLFREALTGAVDDDQIKEIVKPLRELGETVDLPKHFGFLTEWHWIGPFDNTDKKGYDVVYPPEMKVDLTAKYPGKMGEVEWKQFTTEDEYGVLNIAKQLAPHKGAVIYGHATVSVEQPMDVEVRLGTPNAWKLWINCEFVFARDEYHRGTQLDQYRVKARLKSGTNTVLIKVCQNEQTEEWAQEWKYQLRLCDASGAAIRTTSVAGKK